MKRLINLILLISSLSICYGQSGKQWYYNIDENNIALDGFDVVAYFEENKSKIGSSRYTSEYQDVVYHFSSAKNKKLFDQTPEKYLPEYGGWCAFFMGIDQQKSGTAPSRVKPDPTQFLVQNERLYLFFKSQRQNLIERFESSVDSAIIRGDMFWSSRVRLASSSNGKPEGLHPTARMENLLWLPFMGSWEAEARWWADSTGTNWGGTKGKWEFTYGFGGFCIQDNWWPEASGPFSGTISGPAIRGYDPSADEWHMTFIPVNQPRSATWLMTAKFVDDKTLEGTMENVDWRGRKFLQKIIFKSVSANEFIWRAHRSYDGGKTWNENVMETDCIRADS